LFCVGFDKSNSSADIVSIKQDPTGFSVGGQCRVNFDPKTNEIKLLSQMNVDAKSPRAICVIRIDASNFKKQVRLVPLAFKGEVKKKPATVAISSILIGDKPTHFSKTYTTATKFDLTNKISKTSYTTKEKSTLGINLVLMTNQGELELTDMRFVIQEKMPL
jgi:hypothetical protein